MHDPERLGISSCPIPESSRIIAYLVHAHRNITAVVQPHIAGMDIAKLSKPEYTSIVASQDADGYPILWSIVDAAISALGEPGERYAA